ncbi:hypothetical protein GDO81_014123 [Engystomops pustulosus]|uniref:Uncharacterized protein n=1 Tax=Engystomops pustulosus TaxID=76066 RepID=A0AAV7B874_ENGPU|nr:hypothetical protein GDO81_014123 [Engystomops pustulosus]
MQASFMATVEPGDGLSTTNIINLTNLSLDPDCVSLPKDLILPLLTSLILSNLRSIYSKPPAKLVSKNYFMKKALMLLLMRSVKLPGTSI